MGRHQSFNTNDYSGFGGGVEWVFQLPGRGVASMLQPMWEGKAYSEGYGNTMGQYDAQMEIESIIHNVFVIITPEGEPEEKEINSIPGLIKTGVITPVTRVYFRGQGGYTQPAKEAFIRILGHDYFGNPLPEVVKKSGDSKDKKVSAPKSDIESKLDDKFDKLLAVLTKAVDNAPAAVEAPAKEAVIEDQAKKIVGLESKLETLLDAIASGKLVPAPAPAAEGSKIILP